MSTSTSRSSRKFRICSVSGCSSTVHAKGYCRRHYGQIWRRGEMVKDPEWNAARDAYPRGDDRERLRALERELKRAENMYNRVVGFEGRSRWRREMADVRAEIQRIQVASGK